MCFNKIFFFAQNAVNVDVNLLVFLKLLRHSLFKEKWGTIQGISMTMGVFGNFYKTRYLSAVRSLLRGVAKPLFYRQLACIFCNLPVFFMLFFFCTEFRWDKWYSGWERSFWNAYSDWGEIYKYGSAPNSCILFFGGHIQEKRKN